MGHKAYQCAKERALLLFPHDAKGPCDHLTASIPRLEAGKWLAYLLYKTHMFS